MKYLKIFIFILLIIGVGFIVKQYPRMNIISGYAAKNMCTCLFEANRNQSLVENTDNNFSPISLANYDVDTINKSVTSSVWGIMKRKAVYHEDLGCQLLLKDTKKPIINYYPSPHNCPINGGYPFGNKEHSDSLLPNVNYKKLNNAINNVFDPQKEDSLKTRAVIVVHKDMLIAERYNDNFDKNSIILGWSITKSLLATFYGILEKQGKLDINKTHLFPEWNQDDRANISINNLLQMSSGLEWEENYNQISDVTNMLFLEDKMYSIQLNKPLDYSINSHWNYSSGTSNLLSYYLRTQFSTHQEYLDFPVKELYDKLGLSSMMIETDLDGNYVGSSYGWATARDWAKLGLLYLHRGNWDGEQVLNESWVDYISEPCDNSNGGYGAHFWLNAGGHYPDAPLDMYSMNGYQGQRIFIIPSKDMVIVRMGLTESPNFDFNSFLRSILSSIE